MSEIGIKLAEQLYPNCNVTEEWGDWFESPSNYTPIINHFGKVIIRVDDKDYSGDTRVFYRFEGGYGYLMVGWGSCSGCDALQACKTYEEVDSLIYQLQQGIRRFGSAQEALAFFETHDWEGDWTYHTENQEQFIKQVKEFLNEEINET